MFKKKENIKEKKKTCGENINKFTWIFIIILGVLFALAKFGILPKEILSFIQK